MNSEKELDLKINELKNAVYFLSEQIEKNRRDQKTNFEAHNQKIETIDAVNISKITQEYQRKTDLLISVIGSLIGKLETTEHHIHSMQTRELHEMNTLLLRVLTQIRDNQHLTADTLSNLAKHVASQNKEIQKLAQKKPKQPSRKKSKKR